MIYRLIHAEVLAGLGHLQDESVQCVVSSPPYWGLRDYGTARWEGGDADCDHSVRPIRGVGERKASTLVGTTNHIRAAEEAARRFRRACAKCGAIRHDEQIGLEESPADYIARMVDVFREVRRVLRSDGTLWLNIGDSYVTTPNSGTGWESSTLTKANGRARQVQIAQTASQRGGAAATRSFGNMKQKDLLGIPWMLAFALREDGWYLRSEIIWAKPNPMPESITDRPTKAHEQLFLLAKSARYYYDAVAIAEQVAFGSAERMQRANGGYAPPGQEAHRGSAAGPRPNVRAAGGWHQGSRYDDDSVPDRVKRSGNKERKTPSERGAPAEADGNVAGSVPWEGSTRNKRTVWTIPTEPFPEAHFATFPTALVEPCILAGTRVGDVVLDPFNGSGTTGVVALGLQRDYIGIDLNGEYVEMARRRLSTVAPMFAREVPA